MLKRTGGILIILALALTSSACAKGAFSVMPEKTPITPALIKEPIVFQGKGFSPGEPVTIEILVPEELKIKGQTEGEDTVGIGMAMADENGDFEIPMGALTTLNTLFQVGWTKEMTPDFKQATPLPPGTYTIMATGVESDKKLTSILEIIPAPKE